MSIRSTCRLTLSLAILFCWSTAINAQTSTDSRQPLLAKLDCPDRVKAVAFSPDGKLLAAGYGWNQQGGVRIWSVADQVVVANLRVGKKDSANIESIAFSPDGRLFAAANWNGDVKLWKVGSWSSPKTVLANRGSSESLSFSPDNSKLAFSSEDSVLIYDLKSGRTTVLAKRSTEIDSFIESAFLPDGKSIILFSNHAIQVLNIESGKRIKTWKPGGAGFFGNVSQSGNYVIAGGGAIFGKKSVEIWNVRDQRKLGELTGFKSGLFALAISHSEKIFALAGGDYGAGGVLSIWTLNDRREIGFVSFGEFPIQGLAFSPDDSVLAAASEDGFVLLYHVDRLRGPQIKKQDHALCGEILTDRNKTFMVPLLKLPVPMRPDFEYAWKVEIVNSDLVRGLTGSPVVFEEWNIESGANEDQARIAKFRSLLFGAGVLGGNTNQITFGDVQNPGWDKGFTVKIYGNGSFVATNNSGRCLSYGSLDQFKTDFESVKNRLISAGLFTVARDPLTPGADHYRTRFIGLQVDGILELRSDADDIQVLLKGGPAKKREAFSQIFAREELLIKSLLNAGMKTVPD